MTDIIRKTFSADLSVAEVEHCVTARISTVHVDRDGEVLIPQGCDATSFQRSPTVFYNHDYGLPVGKCVEIRRDEECVEAKTQFATRPQNHQGEWLPDTVFSLFQQGVINGFSVGFVPVEGRHPSKADVARMGKSVRYVYSKWKLLEYSVAPLPANEDALVLAVGKGLVAASTARILFPTARLAEVTQAKSLRIVVPPTPKTHQSIEQRIHRHVLRAKGQLYL